ncbi:MAG: hypothetical protein JSV26_10575 [bacterium]|nr:MAG: hypothetical protein JSV26_10575 [bacterium]
MVDTSFLHSSTFTLIVIPFLIFLSRVADVTMETLRIIFVSRGMRALSALAAFFEIIVWLFALSHIIEDMGNLANYAAYAGGFAVGSFAGVSLESRIAIGHQVVRIITRKDARELVGHLKSQGYTVTVIGATGKKGPVNMFFIVSPRRRLETLLGEINSVIPSAFYTVEDLRRVGRLSGPD